MRDASRQAMLEEYLRTAAVVRVYSQPLAERVAALNPRVVQTFAPVDLSLMPPERAARPPGPVKIVYATSRTQDALCEIFLPALARLLGRYAGRVEAHFWGCRPPQIAALPNVRHHGLICQYDRFLRRFSRAGYDIGLAPLPDDVFYRSKTNNKFREYGASGIAGIYSRNDVYSHCVEHEVSGLLVANEADRWHDAIERLIEDEALRTRIQQQARQYVREHYAQEKFEQLFLEQLHEVLGTPARPPLANVASSIPATAASALPGFFRRLSDQGRRSLRTLRRLGPRQAWTALRWFVNDRFLAAWLRWQLWQPRARSQR
jgi:glycosyltransferase involved in cell wall biosynthesis